MDICMHGRMDNGQQLPVVSDGLLELHVATDGLMNCRIISIGRQTEFHQQWTSRGIRRHSHGDGRAAMVSLTVAMMVDARFGALAVTRGGPNGQHYGTAQWTGDWLDARWNGR